jgi:deazaflavin-dependent oxidoreductase (nitroreductase family)
MVSMVSMVEATAQERKPPRRLPMRAMNAVARLVLRSPLHGLMDGKVLLLGFTGRRSGRRYTTPMSYVLDGDEVFMTTEALWWKNLAGGAPVEMRFGGRSRRGFAETLTREEDVAEVLKEILRHYPEYRRYVGVTVDEEGRPVEETVLRAARGGRVGIRVRLDGAA